MSEDQPDRYERAPMSSRDLRDLAERYAQARKLMFNEVQIVDDVNRLVDLGVAQADWHADSAHWDVGHADGGFHDGHYDLHGDMPHWDHSDTAVVRAEEPGGHADERIGPDREILSDPLAVLLNEQRHVLELTRQVTARFEQRLSALEQIVARQARQ
jgi:hypothetical protein